MNEYGSSAAWPATRVVLSGEDVCLERKARPTMAVDRAALALTLELAGVVAGAGATEVDEATAEELDAGATERADMEVVAAAVALADEAEEKVTSESMAKRFTSYSPPKIPNTSHDTLNQVSWSIIPTGVPQDRCWTYSVVSHATSVSTRSKMIRGGTAADELAAAAVDNADADADEGVAAVVPTTEVIGATDVDTLLELWPQMTGIRPAMASVRSSDGNMMENSRRTAGI